MFELPKVYNRGRFSCFSINLSIIYFESFYLFDTLSIFFINQYIK